MTTLDHSTPNLLADKQARDLHLAVSAAALCSPEAGLEFLSDFAAGVGGLSLGLPEPQDGGDTHA